MTNPTPMPISRAAIEAALDGSLSELRPLVEKLFASQQPGEGLLLSQVKALLLKLEHGIVITRSDFISVLQAAGNVRGEK